MRFHVKGKKAVLEPIAQNKSEQILATGDVIRATSEAANRAARAFWGWSKTSAQERCAHLESMAMALDQARDLLAQTAAYEVGATPQWIDFNIDIAKQMLRQACDLIPLTSDQVFDHDDGRRSIIRRQAVGVVLGFAPWNAPITLATRAIAAPIACGNTVVIKASEHCPKTHELLVDRFVKAGLPKDVVTVVTNHPDHSLDVAKLLIRHPTVRRINFTGSSRVGQIVAVGAAQVLKRCLLELSGKAALIVLNDADIDAAVAAAMTGAFFNQGQVCMSTERIIVLEAIADAFVDKLVDKTSALKAADPPFEQASLGRLINAQSAQRIASLIDDAVSNGADLKFGGEIMQEVMQPAVLDHVMPHMRIYREECFGPVASVIRVRDEVEAVSVANDTEFGLASAIFSQDEERAIALADRVEAGVCQINGPTVFDDPSMPFGGMKSSGYGRFGGITALDEFTEIRWLSKHRKLDAHQIEEMLKFGRKKHDH